ncbi:glutathione S-transferase, partial [Pseudohyphozyma bogoriensis]
IRTHAWAGVSIDPFPHLKAWLDRIAERPAVKVGITIPDAGIKADITEEEAKKASEESRANFGFKKDGAFGEEKK